MSHSDVRGYLINLAQAVCDWKEYSPQPLGMLKNDVTDRIPELHEYKCFIDDKIMLPYPASESIQDVTEQPFFGHTPKRKERNSGSIEDPFDS